jgi:hypothetical protein
MRCAVAWICLLGVPLTLCAADAALAAAGTPESLRLFTQQHEERRAKLAEQIARVAELADQQNQPGTAEAIVEFALPLDQQTQNVDRLPDQKQPDLPPGVDDSERHWRTQLRIVRSDYARDLYLLARRALTAGHVSFAYDLVREVAFHDPDHPRARQLLGYVPYDGRWVTPHQRDMLRKGNVWHERFGWLPHLHVERYEAGQRNYNGRWMSADEEAALRHDFRKAWVIETDHFEIRTNHSLERGVELGVLLEEFHRFFRREFAAVFNSPQQMSKLFEGGVNGRSTRTPRHKVHYYQSRQEFVLRLRDKQAGIEYSNGLYLPDDRTTFSFYSADEDEANEATLVHEVTHQLLSESLRVPQRVGVEANFWLIEGIACYLESFEVAPNGNVRVGDPRHIRIENARQRLLGLNFFIPLRTYVALGMSEFQSPADGDTLRGYYSQASGLTHFFMHYEQGLYRDALIEHLAQIYSPNARLRTRPASLAELTGVPIDQLERQYHSYLTEMQAALDQSEGQKPSPAE